MAGDHNDLLKFLDEIEKMGQIMLQSAGNTQRMNKVSKNLKKTWKEMIDMIVEHQDEEEDILLPIIETHFSEQEFDRLIDEILAKFDPMDLFWEIGCFFSWFDQWCNAKTGCMGAHFESKVPYPVVLIGRYLFEVRHDDVLRTLHGIEQGAEVPYSKLPRKNELIVAGGLLLVLYVVFKLLAWIIRLIFCCGGKAKKTKTH
jgi:hypothetical protein